ncbi:UNVERIFIED_CONTAM: hypothetical protein GTU68_031537 [Idotea baltica]|nr:hypothetical protein [Idotea baltica]
MPAVVHIKSTQNARTAQGGRNYSDGFLDQLRQWYGEDYYPYEDNNGRPYQGRQSAGSGVIISGDGYIVTNNHVVENADELEVVMYDNRSFSGKVIGTDPNTDLALVKIEENNLPRLEFADSDKAKIGEWVLAVGNPFNLASTVTAGIISAKGRNLDILPDRSAIEAFIQTDAAVNPGNSGGALVNTNGDLIGINTAIATPTGTFAGYSFAVPVNIVAKVVEDLKAYGKVQRGYLGVQIVDLNGQLAKELGLNITQGVYVDGFMPNSSASSSGITKGDVIISIDGSSVKAAPELQGLIARRRPGDNVRVGINRQGKNLTINVPLKNVNGNTEIMAADRSQIFSELGIEVSELTEDQKQELDLRGGVQVTNIKSGVVSNSTDIGRGFIVTKINEKAIRNIAEFEKLLSQKQGGILMEGVYPEAPEAVYYYGFGI